MQAPWGTSWGEAVEAREREAKLLLEYPRDTGRIQHSFDINHIAWQYYVWPLPTIYLLNSMNHVSRMYL